LDDAYLAAFAAGMPTPQSVSQFPASFVAILGSVATASRIERLIGKMIDLGTLGGSFSVANEINADGEVVGASTTASGATHVFLYRHGHLTDVGTLGGAAADAAAIFESRLRRSRRTAEANENRPSSRMSTLPACNRSVVPLIVHCCASGTAGAGESRAWSLALTLHLMRGARHAN
jgi:probable HAF family extracellular repeat protein